MPLIPTGPLTWLDDATGLSRVAVGGVRKLNYLDDGGHWARIDPSWTFQSPSQYVVSAGDHRVVAHAQCRIVQSWKCGGARRSFTVRADRLVKVRKSDYLLTTLANAGNAEMSPSGRMLSFPGAFPGMDLLAVYSEDELSIRHVFHQTSRDALTAEGGWTDNYCGIATEIDTTGSGLVWNDGVDNFTPDSSGRWGTMSLRMVGSEGTFAVIGGQGKLMSREGETDILVYHGLLSQSNKLYLVEFFDFAEAASAPEGDIWHNATFGNNDTESSNADISDVIVGTNFTMPEDGTGVSISALLDASGSEEDLQVKCRIYSGAILGDNLVPVTNGDTEILMVPGGWNNWKTFAFGSAPTLVNGTVYELVTWAERIVLNPMYLKYGTTSSGTYKINKSQTYGTWPNPLSGYSLVDSRHCAIYCTYTPTGAAGQPIMRRRGGVPGSIKGPIAGRGW